MDQQVIDRLLAKGRSVGDEEWCHQFGRWDCSFCDKVGVMGYQRNCPSCGHSKDERSEQGEYLPEDALYYTQDIVDQLTDAANPDWICGSCDTVMENSLENCSNCGSARSAEFTKPMEFGLGDAPRSSAEAFEHFDGLNKKGDEVKTDFYSTVHASKTPWNWNDSLFRKVGLVTSLSLVSVLGVFGLYWLLFTTTIVNAKVTNMHWTRTIVTEKYVTLTKDDWSVPSDGRVISSRREIRTYDKVPDGYETKTRQVKVKTGTQTKTRQVRVQTGTTTRRYACGTTKTGSGSWQTKYCTSSEPTYGSKSESYSEPTYGYKSEDYQVQKYKSVPVWDTMYKYEVDRWVNDRILKEEGDDKSSLRWPIVNLLSQKEREGPKTEVFTITLTGDNGKSYPMTIQYDRWLSLEYNQTFELELDRLGFIRKSNVN